MSKRIRHTGWVGAMAFAIAALTVFIGSAPAHAQEPEENESQGSFAPYPGDGTDGLESDVDDLQDTVGGSCTYQTRGDNPHRSGNDVSVHGWWKISPASGQCPTHADVEVWLQGWWCGWSGCWWRTIDSDEKRVRPGGGSVGGRMSGNSVPRLKQLDTGTLSMSTLWASVIQPTRNTSSRTSTADLVGDRQAKGREVWCRARFVSGAVAPPVSRLLTDGSCHGSDAFP